MNEIRLMTIDFGGIKSYNSSRGFGFVSRTFFNTYGKVFFHINKIKKNHPELAQKLDSEKSLKAFNFWYEIETTEKGEHVGKFWLNADDIPQNYTSELCDLVQKIEGIWRNIGSSKPTWLDSVTIELIGDNRRDELSAERDKLENQLIAEEAQCRQAEALRENEIGRIAKEHKLTELEAAELHQLLEEMRPLNFIYSKDLSKYIVKYQLGYRYPHISGIVKMEESDTQWELHGGFPKDIYRIICRELNLTDQGTNARAIKFTPFKDVHQNS